MVNLIVIWDPDKRRYPILKMENELEGEHSDITAISG